MSECVPSHREGIIGSSSFQKITSIQKNGKGNQKQKMKLNDKSSQEISMVQKKGSENKKVGGKK